MPRKIILTAVLIAAVLFFALLLPGFLGLDGLGEGYAGALQSKLDSRLASATLFFMLTKLITGILSFLQTIQLDFSVVLAGLNVSPLKVLEPLNQAINSLSNLFLIAMGAIVLEKFLLVTGGWLALKILMPLAMLLGAGSLWVNHLWRDKLRRGALTFVMAAVFVCGAIPASVELSGGLEKYFLNDIVNTAAQRVESHTGSLESMQDNLSAQQWLTSEQAKPLKGNTPQEIWQQSQSGGKISISEVNRKAKEFIGTVTDKAKAIIGDLVNALIVMVVTTLIIPISTMLGLWWLLKWAMSGLGPR